MKVVLELQDQPSNVRRITVRHDIVIGRGTDCNLRLSAPQVSRRHCFLRVGRDSASVTDLDSSNGTFVDGKRITSGKRHDLADGAQLALGPIRFVIHVQGDTVTAEDSKSGGVGAFANSGIRSEAGRSSETPLPVNSTGSTHPDNAVSRTSDLRMNYSLEHGGAAADSDENTSDCLIERRGTQEDVEKFSTESPSNDSRLEIIGFGRQLAEQPESEQAVQHELIVGDDEVPDGENADSSGPAADSDDTAKNPDDDDDIDNRLQDFLKEF